MKNFKETMKVVGVIIGVILVITLLWNVTAYRDVDDLKVNAPAVVEDAGFTNITYQGFSGDVGMGGEVWYHGYGITDGLVYEMAVANWRGEYHIYNLKCINAVAGSTN